MADAHGAAITIPADGADLAPTPRISPVSRISPVLGLFHRGTVGKGRNRRGGGRSAHRVRSLRGGCCLRLADAGSDSAGRQREDAENEPASLHELSSGLIRARKATSLAIEGANLGRTRCGSRKTRTMHLGVASAREPAAIDGQDGAMDVGCGVGSEEDRRPAELLRLPPMPGRDTGQDRGVALRVGA